MKQRFNIGIWGFGFVGKSAVHYFLHQNYTIAIMDNRKLTAQEELYLQKNNVLFFPQGQSEIFFSSCSVLFSSPGVDITKHYATFKSKWVTELDVFSTQFHNKTIAVTGSVGKTSLVIGLQQLLQKKIDLFVGGNIGTPMLNALLTEKQYATALLELSSFQLEYIQHFRPDIAVLTNIYPNHLDRHVNMDEYIKIKCNIFKYQTKKDVKLL